MLIPAREQRARQPAEREREGEWEEGGREGGREREREGGREGEREGGRGRERERERETLAKPQRHKGLEESGTRLKHDGCKARRVQGYATRRTTQAGDKNDQVPV